MKNTHTHLIKGAVSMEPETGKILFGKGELDGHRFHLRKDAKGGTIVAIILLEIFLTI